MSSRVLAVIGNLPVSRLPEIHPISEWLQTFSARVRDAYICFGKKRPRGTMVTNASGAYGQRRQVEHMLRHHVGTDKNPKPVVPPISADHSGRYLKLTAN